MSPVCSFFIPSSPYPLDLHSFPTRRSSDLLAAAPAGDRKDAAHLAAPAQRREKLLDPAHLIREVVEARSEEHTSELQSRPHLVCRLLLEKKNKYITNLFYSTHMRFLHRLF